MNSSKVKSILGGAGRGAGETGKAPGTGARVLAGSKTADAFDAPEKSAGGEAGGTGEAFRGPGVSTGGETSGAGRAFRAPGMKGTGGGQNGT